MLILFLSTLPSILSITEYTSNKHVTEYSCSNNQELCLSCSSSTIYKLDNLSTFEISGYLSSTIKTIKLLLSDLSNSVSHTQTYLSLTPTSYCLSLKQIDPSVSYSTLLSIFLDLEYIDYNLPELEQESEISQMLIISQSGYGDKYAVESIKIDFDIESYTTVADQIVLETKEKRLDLFKGKGIVKYYGVADAGVLFPRFSCEFEYGIRPLMVEVFIGTKGMVNLSQWNNETNQMAKCENVMSPAGLDSIHGLLVNRSVLVFNVSEDLELELVDFVNLVYPPDFATSQGIYLEDIEARMSVKGGSCSLNLQALWNTTKAFNVSLSASENSSYNLRASLSKSPFELTLETYSDLLQSLFSNFTTIFPSYTEDSLLISQIYTMKLENPTISIEFTPESNITLSGKARLLDPSDSELNLITARKDSIIKTEGWIKTNKPNTLFQVSRLSDPEFELTYCTVDLDGVNMNVNVEAYLNCNRSVVCSALVESYEYLNLNGTYLPGDFCVKQSIGEVKILDLTLNTVQLVLNLSDYTVILNGTTELDLSGSSLSVFEGKILSSLPSSELHSSIRKESKGLVGSSSLFVFFATFSQTMNAHRVLNYNLKGLCGFRGVNENWSGDIDLTISEYKVHKYQCLLPYVSTSLVFKYLAGMKNPDYLVNFISFPYGLGLNFDEFFTVNEPIEILGLSGRVNCRVETLPNVLYFKLNLQDWLTGFGNVRVKSSTGSLEVYSSYSVAQIKGSFSLWDVNQETVLKVEEDSMSFSLSGYFFSGFYWVEMIFVTDIEVLESATWAGKFEISSEDLQNLTFYVNNTLVDWVLDGQLVLEQGLSVVLYYRHLFYNATNGICPKVCGKREYPSSKMEHKCIERAKKYQCSDSVQSCDPDIDCESYKLHCFNTDCSESVQTCSNYTESCNYSNPPSQCTNFTFTEIGSECLQYSLSYTKTLLKDQNCEKSCKFNDNIYDYYLKHYRMLNQTYNQNLQSMRGFLKIDLESMFKLYFITGHFKLTEPGQSNFEVLVDFKYWQDGESKVISEYIPWSFIDTQKNVETLTTLIKSFIILNSDTFTDDLLQKSAKEVYLESLYSISSK